MEITHDADLVASSPAPAQEAASAKSAIARIFDAVILGIFPLIARGFGYGFRVGTNDEIRRDARSVLGAVWRAKGVKPAADVAWYGERYDRATTWVVAYRGAEPVGVMGIVDMRIASIALDYGRRIAPRGLRLGVTRELGRLAILPAHRGGLVMVGLLINMYAWVSAQGIALLFSGSTPALFRVYERYNPTARLVQTETELFEDHVQERYFAPLRAYGGRDVVYTFEVAPASPFAVLARFLSGLVRRRPQSTGFGSTISRSTS
jgi:hypothetical protein